MLTQSPLNNFKKNIIGKHFSQQNLPIDLQNATCGQSIFFRLISVLTSFLLNALSGIVTSFLGAWIAINIILPYPNQQSVLSFLCLSAIVTVWLITTVCKGIDKGLLIAGMTIFATFVLTISVGENSVGSLIINIFGIALIFLSLLTEYFTFTLIAILFDTNYRTLRMLYVFSGLFIGVIIIGLSVFSGILDNEHPAFGTNNLIDFVFKIRFIAVICGIVVSTIMVLLCLKLSNSNRKKNSHFEFIRTWAIAVGSWGGTSFHNLDLSGVNFKGAKLANTDLRARKLYRTCLQGVTGLERARVDSRYLDLENPKVQRLLTHGYSEDKDFSRLNLRGAYLQCADMHRFELIDTDLTGADLQGADLRGSILVRAQVIGVDFTGANLTGICIEDWSVNSQTCFTGVQCDYIYRKLDEKGEPTDRYPADRNFEPREFESLYQEVGNVVELIFKEGVNWRAFSFSLQKLQIEDDGLGLELKGFEKRGDRWVVKVTHNESASRQEVEQRLYGMYNEMKNLLAAKEQQINKLLGIAADQAEALKSYSKQPFGNSFFIVGSTITNLAGSGQIDYDEAAGQVRSIVANGGDLAQFTTVAQNLLRQLQEQSVATTSDRQAELIQQVILTEVHKDPFFRQFFIQQGQQIADALPEGAIASAILNALSEANL